MKTIIATVDFSDLALDIIEVAGDLAKKCNGEVILLHVSAPVPVFVGNEVGTHYIRELSEEDIEREQRDLQALTEYLSDKGVSTTSLLLSGPVIETILEQKDKFDADLIVMGASNHGIFYKAFLGSVSQGILRRANIPVLIIPERQD